VFDAYLAYTIRTLFYVQYFGQIQHSTFKVDIIKYAWAQSSLAGPVHVSHELKVLALCYRGYLPEYFTIPYTGLACDVIG